MTAAVLQSWQAAQLPSPPPSGPAASTDWSAAQTAAIIVAAIALIGSVLLWVLNQHAARRERRNAAFGEALAAVERYMELPFRIRRRRPGIPARHDLATMISDIQVELAHHQSWLDLVAPNVATSYRELVAAARNEAGTAMSTAWLEQPIITDDTMNLGTRFARHHTDTARARCIDTMHRALGPHFTRRSGTPPTPPDRNASAPPVVGRTTSDD